MDTDLSHEALERFDAIERRLDALEGGTEADGGTLQLGDSDDEPEDENEE